jgi:hypothetical protein
MLKIKELSDANVYEKCCAKLDGNVLNGSDNLFVITGAILVTEFVGVVTTVIGGVANCHIDMVVTDPAGTTAMSTDVAIDTDATGTSYTFTAADNPSVLTPTTAGVLAQIPRIAWLLPAGTLKAHCSAARTGVIEWYIFYKPLTPNALVTAAA